MNEQRFFLGRIDGIDIIPSDDIPPGYKRTTISAIFVNEHNYELMKAMSVKAMLMILGGVLREIESLAEEEIAP